ncbi:MAG TPA: MEDS domain-containing protein [Pseudonocardiaceae bacterium]
MSPNPSAVGIPGVHVAPGDHICAFYPGLAERDEILIPYLREGLEAGNKCICVVDATDPEAVFALLGPDVDLGSCLERRQLDVQRSEDTYLSGDSFSTEVMLDFWDRSIGEAIAGGFDFARAVGEMTWALRQLPGVEELMGYEARLNQFLPRYPQVILCLYELDRFSGEVLVDVLKTHPKVLMAGMVLDNPYYLKPEEFLASRH